MRGGSRWWTATIIALDAPVMLIVLMAYTDDTIQAVATAVIFEAGGLADGSASGFAGGLD